MVLFGKEIKLETNMSPKEAKLSLLIISLAVVIILGYFQIFIPIMDIKNLNNEIEMKKSEKIGEETKKKAAQREYDDRIQMYNEQNGNYLMSKAKFDQSSLIDDTSLKIMAAYNGGSVRVRNNTWRNVTETSNYVKRIDWAMKAYEYKLPIYLKIKEFL